MQNTSVNYFIEFVFYCLTDQLHCKLFVSDIITTLYFKQQKSIFEQ